MRKTRSLLRRRRLDDGLDWLRFRLDTFPRNLERLRPVDYQELPWIGLQPKKAYRSRALETRWSAMLPLLKTDIRTAVDIGSNSGWFVAQLSNLGLATIGIESDQRIARIALYARKSANLGESGLLIMNVKPENSSLIPNADVIVFLSVWHHFVRDYGLERATEMLATIWERTGRVLFFETGEAEMPDWWGLPAMNPEPRTWLQAFLESTCEGAEIAHLGLHETVSAAGDVYERNLFAAVRK
jgi:hypothetical protein